MNEDVEANVTSINCQL